MCSPLDGLYRFSYRPLAGNCGSLPDEVLEFRNGRSLSAAASNCQASFEMMATACELHRDTTCPVNDAQTGALLGNVRVAGVLTESVDNNSISGTFDVGFVHADGSSCKASYGVTAVKVGARSGI